MRVVIQRVTNATLSIDNEIVSKIGLGLVVLLGIEHEDGNTDVDYLVQKIIGLRIFDDEQGIPNLSIKDVSGEILLVSQFTLHAHTKKGNRPSYIRAARPEQAVPLYEHCIQKLSEAMGHNISTGRFGAMMQIALVNDGPFTILMDSKNKDL